MKIIVDKNIPYLRGVLEPYATVVYLAGQVISRSDLTDADAMIVRTRTKCNAALLEGTRVRFIATATIGHDHIDAEYCDAHGIRWTNAEGCNSSSVQQYIGAVLAQLSTQLNFSCNAKTLGIVGVGNVGTKVAALARALGMRVLLNDPPRARREGGAGFVPIDTLIEHADIITFHVPLIDGGRDNTFYMADERFLSRLRPTQIVINTSRGEVVQGSALKALLQRGGLQACVLDVWEQEPMIDIELLHKCVIGTPHIAGYSADGKANGTSMSVNALSRFFGWGALDAWKPGDVPAPREPEFTLDCEHLSKQDAIKRAILHTYDICADDERLRRSVQTFERQRADYPLRREFTSYTITLKNASSSIRSALETLGFTCRS
ncbi:MAG TPA: 4-phosphoerythronate dehydrogenase PdxB [Bacteroidota bacterium]|nr:4-phosphoerythronate dehydrogenase PdxB [Bacteroidota bacterium]